MLYSVITMLVTFTQAKIILILTEKDYFNVSEDEIGRVSNDMVFYPQILMLFYYPMSGHLFELIGRRALIIISFFLTSIMTILIPYTAPSTYGWLMVVVIVRGLSVAGPLSNPLTSDYVRRNSRS